MYHGTLDKSFLDTVSTFFILFSPIDKKIGDGAELRPQAVVHEIKTYPL